MCTGPLGKEGYIFKGDSYFKKPADKQLYRIQRYTLDAVFIWNCYIQLSLLSKNASQQATF